MRKIVSLLLCLVLMLSVALPAMAQDADVTTVTVFVGDPLDQPTSDNKIYKLIEDELGLKFEFEFLAGDLDETLGIKIAGEDYADLICGSNSNDMLIDAGAMIDLMPYLSAEKTPNLWTHIEPYLGRLLNEKGELYIVPNFGRNYNEQIINYCNGPAFFIQKKVLAWDNYPTIKTVDQYFDLIQRYLAANPTTEDGKPYTGFEVLSEDWRAFCLFNPVQHLMGRPNDGDVIIDINNNYKVDAYVIQDYAKDYYKKLNEMFKAGVISQDTFVMNFDQYIGKISSGTVLGMFDQYWDFQDATNALTAAKMYDSTYCALPLTFTEDQEEHYLNGSVINVNRGFGISSSCQFPEKLVSMMETLLSDRWQTILWWGIEGEDYYVENGRYMRTAEQKDNADNAVWCNANKAKAMSEYLPKKQGTMDNGNSWDPALQPEIYFDLMSDYDKAFLNAYGYKVPADFFNPPIELAPYGEAWQIDLTPDQAANDAHTAFQNIERRDLPQIIMSKDDAEFDAKWADFVKAVEDIPISDFIDFMQSEVNRLVEQNTK